MTKFYPIFWYPTILTSEKKYDTIYTVKKKSAASSGKDEKEERRDAQNEG